MNPHSSRSEHLWYYIAFFSGLAIMEGTRKYILSNFDYNFEVYIIYNFLLHFLITAIVANTVSLIFFEVRVHFVGRHLMIKKVLPLLRFTLLVTVWFIGFLYFTKNLNINISGFLTGAGIGGALFLLGARDMFANFIGTMTIVMSHMFEIGDLVGSGTGSDYVQGVVEEITLNYTKITNTEGKIVYIPNRILLSEKFENITRRRFFLQEWEIHIPRKITLTRVLGILTAIEKKVGSFSPRSLKFSPVVLDTDEYKYILKAEFDEEDEGIIHEIENYILEKTA